MNLKSIVAGLAAVAVLATSMVTLNVVNAQTVDAEFDGALAEAYVKGMTKYSTAEGFRPFDMLTREQAAKFMSVFAAKEMCIVPDTTLTCTFDDVPADPTLADSVRNSCQQGLFKGSNGMFYPTAPATKAQIAMVMARAIAAIDDTIATPTEDGAYWFEDAYNILWDAGITNDSDPSDWERPILRYEALYFITRAEGVECSDDITDLLEDIFGDDNDDMDDDNDDDDDDDDSDPIFETSDGEVIATLSPLTPAGDTVPGLASVWVASFDFSATGEDVMLENIVLERFGLGSDDVIDDVTILVNNEVVSKSRNFNSDAELNTSLNPAVEVEAGETVRLDVVVKIGDTTDASNEEFQIGLTDFESNGSEDTSNLPLRGNEFEVAGTGINAAEAIVTDDGTVSDVELGETDAEVAKFEIENDGDDAIYITHITLEDEEKNADEDLANFKLTHNNQVVATKAMTNGKYLSFVLDTPVMIDEGETEDFKVLADVVEGAGDQISFIIDEEIYIRGYDERFGYGIAVDVSGYSAQLFDINAGELTLVELDIDRDELRSDRESFVIAAFDLNVNAGQDLILEDIEFSIDAAGGSVFPGAPGRLIDHFDEVELVVMTNNSRRTYDLETNNVNNDSFTAGDDDLGINLPDSGKVTILVEVDSIGTFPLASIGEEFEVSLSAADLRIEETADDEEVTDIVPSNIVFDRITFVESTVEVNGINITDVQVVKGSENVDAVMFEVESDDVSGVYIESFTFGKSSGSAAFDQNVVDAVRVWKKTGATWELIEEEGGFDITGGTITLDDFDPIFVPVASSQVFLMTVDISEDDANIGDDIEFQLEDIDIEDDDNTQLTVLGDDEVTPISAANAISSNRTIDITGAGTLQIQADNNDSEIDNTPTFVVAGRTAVQSPFVASFELTANNEAVEIEDLVLTASGVDVADFEDAVTEVEIYDEDKTTLLFTEVVSSSEVDFNNINFVVEEGSTNIYVKIVTELIGNNENGLMVEDLFFTISIDQVQGVDSGDDVTPATGPQGLDTEFFSVIPVAISNVSFVNSAEGQTVDTTVPLDSPSTNVAIIKIDADTWANSDRTDGGDLELIIDGINVRNSNPSVLDNLVIRRLDVNNSTFISGTVSGSDVYFSLTGTNVDSNAVTNNERQIQSGQEGYFLIQGDIDAGASASARISLIGFTNPGQTIIYGPSDVAAPTDRLDVIYLGVNQLQGPLISVTSD